MAQFALVVVGTGGREGRREGGRGAHGQGRPQEPIAPACPGEARAAGRHGLGGPELNVTKGGEMGEADQADEVDEASEAPARGVRRDTSA